MKQGSLYETFIQLAALVFAFIVVQATYTTVIRPVAADIQAYQAEQQQVNEDFVPERSVFVILKDFEQQACITTPPLSLIVMAALLVSIARCISPMTQGSMRSFTSPPVILASPPSRLQLAS